MASKIPVVVSAGQLGQLQAADDLGALKTTSITVSGLTSTRVPYAAASGLLTDDADLTFDGTKLSTKSIGLAATSSSMVGVIKQGAANLINTYAEAGSVGLNVFIGPSAGNFTLGPSGGANHLGSRNFAIGAYALLALTTGYQNVGLGVYACGCTTTGGENLAIGYSALYTNTTGYGNVAIGTSVLSLGNGDYNTAIGFYAGHNTTGAGGVFIGRQAGYYETGAGKLYIDNAPRTNEADERIKAMIYGVFAAAPVDQDLVFNTQVGVNITPSAWLTLRAGSATAGTAPLKLTSGTVLGTPEAGAIEFDGTNLYFTDSGGTRRTLAVV